MATPRGKDMFDMVSGRKRGEEHLGDSQGEVESLRTFSNGYLYNFDRVLIRGQPI